MFKNKKLNEILRWVTLSAFLFLGFHNLAHKSSWGREEAACSICTTISQTPALSGQAYSALAPTFSAQNLFVPVDVVLEAKLFTAKNLRSPPSL